MISFRVNGMRFNFRSAAVIIDDGHVLLHRALHQDYWSLPGGRVEAGEASAATIARELAEELGPRVDARVERLLWVVENFFRLEGEPCHALGMFYLVMLGESSPYLRKERPFDGVEDALPLHDGADSRLIFQWFPLETLADVPLYPTFLRERLTHLPAAPELVTHARLAANRQ